jgi:hypothetical protein
LEGATRTLANSSFRSLWPHVAPDGEEALAGRLSELGPQAAVRRTWPFRAGGLRQGGIAAGESASAGHPETSAP